MKCLRYPEYKTTGFKWLGEVPSHWGVGRTSRYFQIAMGETILQENLEEDGTWPVFSATDGDQYLGKVSNPRVRLFPGDIVIPARGNSIGAVKLVREAATTSQTTIYCKRISPEKFISEYVFFFMRGCRANLFYFTQTAIPQITVGEVGANPILVPPILEQQAIVDFLDQETSKIDALISEQRRLIELLKEKRQAVISHAVTKGVNPDVRMKPSGVEWLGEVPEHWEVRKVSQLFKAAKGTKGQMLTKEFLGENEGEYPVYSGQTENEGVMGRWDQYEFDFGNAGVLFSTTVGAKAMHLRHLFGKFSLSQNCMIIWPTSPKCQLRFFYYHFQPLFRYQRAMIPEHMQASFRVEDLKGYLVAIPPQDEQIAISKFVDGEILQFDALVSEAESAICLLQERRTALISAAVTGKIDVRNYAATQKDAA